MYISVHMYRDINIYVHIHIYRDIVNILILVVAFVPLFEGLGGYVFGYVSV